MAQKKAATNRPSAPERAANKNGTRAATVKFPIQRFRVKLVGVEGMEVAGLRVPFDVQEAFGTRARVPVRGTLLRIPNGASKPFAFRSSIMNMGDGHFMAINKEMRAGAGVKAGDVVDVVMERDIEQRVIEPPADFKRALAASKTASALFEELSYTHRKEYVRWITEAKKEETRQRRITRAIEMLSQGTKTPG